MANWNTPIRRRYRQLVRDGMPERDAANYVAYEEGLDIPPRVNWTMEEVERMLFLRAMEDTLHPDHLHDGPPPYLTADEAR